MFLFGINQTENKVRKRRQPCFNAFFFYTCYAFGPNVLVYSEQRITSLDLIYHSTVKEVWISGLNYNRSFRLLHFFVAIEKIYETLETVFHRLSKYLKFRQKCSAAGRIFSSLLGV